MEFIKFPSIEGVWREKYIEKVKGYLSKQCNSCDWIVQEKIHGANFSIITDGINVKYASRNRVLSLDDNFYSFQDCVEKNGLKEKTIKVFFDLKARGYTQINYIQIYGELCGGHYPNCENNFKPIQKGVYYSPEIEFVAFGDILINGDEFLNRNVAVEILEGAGFHVSPVLFKTDEFDNVVNYKNEFESEIFKLFDLPKIEGNICEGVVIKPVDDFVLHDGSRVVLKSKNEKFMEKAKELKQKKLKKELSEDEKNFLNEIFKYITENRFNNVVSKISNISDKDFGKLLVEFQKDIENEFIKDVGLEIWNVYMSHKNIRKLFSKECANFIRPFFVKQI